MTDPAAIRPGAVFTIPIDEESSGVGQVVAVTGGSFAVVTFPGRLSHDVAEADAQKAVRQSIQFFAVVLDALFFRHTWNVVAHAEVPPGVPWPAYQVLVPGGVQVESFDRSMVREATEEEAESLPRRQTFSAMVLQRAVRAANGEEEWKPMFDDLVPVAKRWQSSVVFPEDAAGASPPAQGRRVSTGSHAQLTHMALTELDQRRDDRQGPLSLEYFVYATSRAAAQTFVDSLPAAWALTVALKAMPVSGEDRHEWLITLREEIPSADRRAVADRVGEIEAAASQFGCELDGWEAG